MLIVPIYAEVASSEQWYKAEKALRDLGICFFERDKIEGLTLEDVEKHFNGNSNQTALQRAKMQEGRQ